MKLNGFFQKQEEMIFLIEGHPDGMYSKSARIVANVDFVEALNPIWQGAPLRSQQYSVTIQEPVQQFSSCTIENAELVK